MKDYSEIDFDRDLEVENKQLTHDEIDKIIDDMIEYNEDDYNLLKAIEELAELQEKLIKKVIKKGGPKEPSNEEVIEEIGDVAIRLVILTKLFGEDAVCDRMDYKLTKFKGYMNEGKYIGRI